MADIILRDLADTLNNQLLDELRTLALPGKSKRTIEAYQYDINQYIDYCLEKSIPVWSKEFLQSFVDFYCEKNKKGKTVNRKLSAIKKALSYIADNHLPLKEALLIKQALKDVKGVKLNNDINHVSKTSILTREEVHTLFEKTSDRLSLMIEFLYFSGCRVSEMCDIKLQDIKENDSVYKITIKGKENKIRTIKIKKELIHRVQDFLREKNTYLKHSPEPSTGDSIFLMKLGKPEKSY